MDALNIGTRREVCWDEYLMDRTEGIAVKMHKPEYRGVAMTCDKPWEGNVSGFFTIISDEGRARVYYRGMDWPVDCDGNLSREEHTYFCYAESKDGISFTRVPVGMHSYQGSKENNIIRTDIEDNISFFKDTNPECPPEARYKGLAEHVVDGRHGLYLFVSADGVHYQPERLLAEDGAYDSLNIAFWDDVTQQYYLFYRGLHGKNVKDSQWSSFNTADISESDRQHGVGVVRDVRMRTSKDFVNWSEPRRIEFGPENDDLELYTNNVRKYYRAKHMFIGFPMRYVDRYKDAQNFPHLPDWKCRQAQIRFDPRAGTAITDSLVMTSRDGVHFRRQDESFLTSGIERGTNWYYGDGGMSYGMWETPSEIPGAPNEISIYSSQDLRVKPLSLLRYAVRLDGFFSWHCDYKPGKVVTKPIVFGGNSLSINFATSAIGYVQIRMLDADGNAIEGYDSGKLFGDSVDRTVDFEKQLADLAGKEVRLEISMSDAELYSFKFEEIPAII